jgi:hypothetical protein
MEPSDLEKGDFILSVSSSVGDPYPSTDGGTNLTDQPYNDCVRRGNAEFFSGIQSLSDDDLAQFSKRTRVLEFRHLSRFYLTYLEWMLLQDMRSLRDHLGDPTKAEAKVERIGKMLHNYGTTLFIVLCSLDSLVLLANTVQDMEFMRQHDCQSIGQRLRTFDVYRNTETTLYNMLYGEKQEILPFEAESPVISRKLAGSYEPNTISHLFQEIEQRKRSLRDMVRRFRTAILGGISLVVPMLIMVLCKSRNTGLITVSVATFVFAACVAIFSKAEGSHLLMAVATYAAVLVVFVGASGP